MNTAHGLAITGGTPGLESAVLTYLGHLSAERGLAANTLTSYRRDLLRYVDALSGRGRSELGQVSEDDVLAFLAALREGDVEHPPLSAGSAARAVVAVRGLHRFALREGLTAADPASGVRPPARPRRPPKAISAVEAERLIAAADAGGEDTARALRDRALLEVLYGSGVRISEAVGLDVDHLALTEGFMRVPGKGGRERIVPVGGQALRAVEAYLARARPALAAGRNVARSEPEGGRAGGPALFLNARGGRLSRQGAWMVLRAAAGRAGLSHVSPHTLRHSFAAHLVDGGADPRVVQELLGQASVATPQAHTPATARRLREAYTAAHPRAR